MKLEENIHTNRINELLKAYKIVASREKLEKERKKYPAIKRRQFNSPISSFSSTHANPNAITGTGIGSSSSLLSSSDKYGILSPAFKRVQSGNLNQPAEQAIGIEQQFKSLVQKSTTVENFDPLSDDFFTKNITINSCNFSLFFQKFTIVLKNVY